MAGACIEKIIHEKCGKKNLQTFFNDDETFSGFCYSCEVVVPDPYGNNPPTIEEIVVKTPEEIQEEIDDIRACPRMNQDYRSIPASVWKHYGVRMLLSPRDGKSPYGLAYPFTRDGKITGFKIKLFNSKTMWVVGDVINADPYGWEHAKRVGNTLYITEGEEDTQALRHILKETSPNPEYDYAVVSLTSGVNTVKTTLGRMLPEIKSRFKDVVIVFDTDEAGIRASKEAKKILPEARIALLPEKDANDCLRSGRLKAARNACVFQSRATMGNTTLPLSSVIADAMKDPEWGLSYPWAALTDFTYGQRKGELVSIGGGTGTGKTLIGHELAAWNAKVHGWHTLMIMMEETSVITAKSIAGKIDNVPYHVPIDKLDKPYDVNQLEQTLINLSPYITLWDISTITDPETLLEQIEEVITSTGMGLDCVMIDNMTTMSEGLNASETNDFIGTVASSMGKLALKFDLEIILFSHLNSPPRGARSHENGGKVLESQFTGSRALQRYSHFMIGFERNKQGINEHVSKIRILKNRPYGRTGMFKTIYTPSTGRLKQSDWDDELFEDKD